MMPTDSITLSGPASCGTTVWKANAAQSGGAIEQLDQVADGDDADEAADDQLDRPEAAALQRQQPVGGGEGDQQPDQQRQVEQQRLRPMAAPSDSARSVAIAATSLATHMAKTSGRGKCAGRARPGSGR